MFSWEDTKDRVAIVQLNAELRHAQLELLSAQCATDRLRLRYAGEDIARFAERQVLHKAVRAANSLNEYYSSVLVHLEKADQPATTRLPQLAEKQIEAAVQRVAGYLREQREKYFLEGEPIPPQHRAALRPFFRASLLEHVRVVEMHGARVPNPPFYEEARALGFTTFPEIRHMPSLAFIDVLVFNEAVLPRRLFHGLVHAAQFLILGLERYTELFVRGFLKARLHITVPLESHAIALESRFVEAPTKFFSVEDEVRLWAREQRY